MILAPDLVNLRQLIRRPFTRETFAPVDSLLFIYCYRSDADQEMIHICEVLQIRK